MKYKKIKPRKRKFKDSKILLLLILLMYIGIGYAALTTTLSINGTTNVATNTWNIHFANIQVKSGSVTGNPDATLSGNSMSITYGGELAQPGDYYEFNVDVVNEGTLPGKISIVSLTGNNTDYLSTSYTYDNDNAISLGDILNAGKSKKLKIRAWIPSDIDTTLLPTSDTPVTLTFNLQYIQSEVDALPGAFDTIVDLASTNLCIEKYTGQVTDQVGQTVAASNVYFDKCADKRNIKFAGYCWQVIRTTDTGGVKMIYNGEPDNNGECGSSRGNHIGIVGANGETQLLNADYLYGSGFTYDTTNNNFTLTDTSLATWSDSTYENLLGKYTCKTTDDTCTTIYYVNNYYTNVRAYVASYTIGSTNYAFVGKSVFNSRPFNPAMVGYMFNKEYPDDQKMPKTVTYKYGSTFTYDTGTNTYTLSGTTKDISDWSTGYNTINRTHYTCWNATGTCNTISYIYRTDSNYAEYFDITGGKSISDILIEMLSSNDVNRYSSAIKGIIDTWYAQNLSSKTNMLEDTVYCNARNIINYGGFNPDGGNTGASYVYSSFLRFKNYTLNNDLSCPNETDQFSVSNNKAKLTYPVALATHEELYTLTNNNDSTYYDVLTKTNDMWRNLSPSYFGSGEAYVRLVKETGNVGDYYTRDSIGVRLVVSLANGVAISGGSGSESDPWIIQE